MSDDIPLIFAQELQAQSRAAPRAVFASAASQPQLEQYTTAGWSVVATQDFTGAQVDFAALKVPRLADGEITGVTLFSCEAPHLNAATAGRIAAWRPEVVKINCAFHNVADADGLAGSLEKQGYQVLGALWRDDNSFKIRSVQNVGPLAGFAPPAWDRLNIIAVRDVNLARAILVIGRLYAGEEARISELRVTNSVRGDTIARLEDALIAHQSSDVFKLRKS